jgi:hypothetical protein
MRRAAVVMFFPPIPLCSLFGPNQEFQIVSHVWVDPGLAHLICDCDSNPHAQIDVRPNVIDAHEATKCVDAGKKEFHIGDAREIDYPGAFLHSRTIQNSRVCELVTFVQ